MDIKGFWTWFAAHEQELREEVDLRDQNNSFCMQEMVALMHQIDENIFLEIATNPKKLPRKYNLTISCDGLKDSFMMVETLVNWAPPLEYWKFQAFIQPKGPLHETLNQPFTFNEYTILPKSLRFTVCNATEDFECFVLLLQLPISLRSMPPEVFDEHIFYLLFHLYGEKFIGENILDIETTFVETDEYDFYSLEELEEVLASFRDGYDLSRNKEQDI
ncbi:hypothetical protein QRD02_13500 [Aequorivita sp. SDUM287046]|uniref:DUF695 domain-containing protein n=1 Tax=Aequorivita aurantiaca TaxID=3053356 RepID=A0ABT8DK20_9FLAO|nr:hypothetical protein [Aequorivita aurantiaca]MDN3725398.1 hypothetical protein [Aequorivita aurantiaca]